jgi:hypothetical protein
MTPNPFTFGNPIRDPAHFIGRQSDLRQIVNRLRSSAHESTSIVGERRIGKTSLLKYLENKEAAAALGLPPEEFCLVYMDFQGLMEITPQRFWARILQKIERTICCPDLAPILKEVRARESLDLFDLEDLFTCITDEGLTVVLLLDEFEYVTQNSNFGSDFFGGLRALAIHHNLPMITATRRELVDLCHSDIKGSPFFNIFANLVLKPFSPEDVDQLIDTYLEGTGVTFCPEERDLVWALGGGYPFFTQIAANYTFEAKQRGETGDALIGNVTQSFEEQVDAHFQYMWSRTNESEKITVLATMALDHNHENGDAVSPTLENLANLHSRAHLDVPELVKRGLLVEETDETYRLLSPSLERWICREIQAPPGEEASATAINEWLTAGGQTITMEGLLRSFKDKYWSILAGLPEEFSQKLTTGKTLAEQANPLAADLSDSVFICYSRNETAFVDRLVADLNAEGVKTWRDVDNIPGSRQSNLQGWRMAIEKALNGCGAMLIVLSPGAVDSHEVQAEWNHFASHKRPIYPIIANACDVPFYLKIYQIWDLSDDDPGKVSQLAKVLKSAVSGP